MRTPYEVWREAYDRKLIRVGGFFDQRMYRATWRGRLFIWWAKFRKVL